MLNNDVADAATKWTKRRNNCAIVCYRVNWLNAKRIRKRFFKLLCIYTSVYSISAKIYLKWFMRTQKLTCATNAKLQKLEKCKWRKKVKSKILLLLCRLNEDFPFRNSNFSRLGIENFTTRKLKPNNFILSNLK